MDKNSQTLNKYINDLNSTIKSAYTDISETVNDSFQLGKKEAYDELLQWMKEHHNPEFKYISPFAIFNIIQEKINKTNINLGVSDVSELNFSKMKLIENRKRINPYAQRDLRDLMSEDDSLEEDSIVSKSESKNSFTSINSNSNINNLHPQHMFQNKKKKFK